METRPLGRTGFQVSAMSAGAAAMGGEYGERTQREVNETVDRAIELGVNYFDTSPYYGRTRSEEALGTALNGKRAKVFLSTKTGRFDFDAFDFTEKRLRAEVDNSLRRLQTDHVDLLIAHDIEFADPAIVLNEGLPTLQALKEEGKTRFIGASGLPLHVLQTAHEQFPHLDAILSYCRYCLNDTAMIPYAERWRADGLGVINASPLSMGLLTHGGPQEWHPAPAALKAKANEAAEWCAERGANLAFLAMQFAFQCPAADTTMTGTARRRHLESNIEALNATIDEEILNGVLDILRPVQNLSWQSGIERAWRDYQG